MSGNLDNSGVYVIGPLTGQFNGTVSLTSSSPSRKIEISVNGGLNYSLAQYDVDEPGVIGVVIKAAVTHIKFTGSPGDFWNSLV